MLTGSKCRCLQRPIRAIIGGHQQIIALDCAICTDEMNDHMKVFTPLGTVLYGES